jgi:hypothetical protein
MHIFSIILLPIGVVAGASYYFFNRKESKKWAIEFTTQNQ